MKTRSAVIRRVLGPSMVYRVFVLVTHQQTLLTTCDAARHSHGPHHHHQPTNHYITHASASDTLNSSSSNRLITATNARALHGTAPPYMTSQFTHVADMPNRRRLRSASSYQLDVPSFRLPTVGSRAFPTAGAKVWNSLPDDVTSAPSLSTIFRRHLKTHLFRCCYNTL